MITTSDSVIVNQPNHSEGDSDSLVTGKINASDSNPTCKAESLVVVDSQPTQASVDNHVSDAAKKNEKKRRFSIALSKEEIEDDIAALAGGTAVINVNHVLEAVKNNQKKQRFWFSLSREEIEDDIAAIEALEDLAREEIGDNFAAIEALAGKTCLRRPKKRAQPQPEVDQRRLDHLFPGLEYFYG